MRANNRMNAEQKRIINVVADFSIRTFLSWCETRQTLICKIAKLWITSVIYFLTSSVLTQYLFNNISLYNTSNIISKTEITESTSESVKSDLATSVELPLQARVGRPDRVRRLDLCAKAMEQKPYTGLNQLSRLTSATASMKSTDGGSQARSHSTERYPLRRRSALPDSSSKRHHLYWSHRSNQIETYYWRYDIKNILAFLLGPHYLTVDRNSW